MPSLWGDNFGHVREPLTECGPLKGPRDVPGAFRVETGAGPVA
jgi:hypothetical protein